MTEMFTLRLKLAKGPAADRDKSTALPILEAVCSTARQPTPRLLIVEHLPGGAGVMGRGTAKATTRGGPGIMLPVSLVDRLTPAAFENLMAHELGHLVFRRSRWAMVWNSAMILFVVGIASVFGLMAVMINRETSPGLSIILSLAPVALLGVLTLVAYASRQQEHEADLFAARIQGNLQGAREITEHNVSLRANDAPKAGRLSRLLATHPEPTLRFARLQRDFGTATHTQEKHPD